MLEILNVEQGSPEWYRARLGRPTASCFAAILAKGEGKVRKSYMLKLLGERFTGEPADNYVSPDMQRGKEMEDEARRAYVFNEDAEITRVGFIRNGKVGCSPDSLIGDRGLLEIKTRLPHLQCEVLLADKLPPEHMAQVQGQLWVAEREWCDFVAYWPRLPLFKIRVFRDGPYLLNLAMEVERFCAELEALTLKLKSLGATPAEIAA